MPGFNLIFKSKNEQLLNQKNEKEVKQNGKLYQEMD
jgi:hypothetical protein